MALVPEYDIIGMRDGLYCRAIEVMIEKGYSKYNLDKEVSLIVECGRPDTPTVLRTGEETKLGDMEYNAFMLEDDKGVMAITVFNALYGSEVFANLSMAMGDILATQYIESIHPVYRKQYEDTLELICFSLSSYIAIDILKEIEMFGQAKILMDKFKFLDGCYDELMEDTEEDKETKIDYILELIGYNYSLDTHNSKPLKEQLKSSHLTLKTVEKLQYNMFIMFKTLLNKETPDLELIKIIEDNLESLDHIL